MSGEYGRGFGRRSLFRMIQFAESFPDGQIVSAQSAQLSWSHFVELIALNDPSSATSPPSGLRRSPPDPALEFLENVEAQIEAELGEEVPGGQGGQFAGVRDQLGLGSFPHMFPGRQGDPVFTA